MRARRASATLDGDRRVCEDQPLPISRRTLLYAGAGALAGFAQPPKRVAARLVFPADGEVNFLARRQDRMVGSHRIRFAHTPAGFVVRSDIDIDVRAGAAPLQRFAHHAEEIWRDGWLEALVSDTDDDGRRFQVRAGREAEIFAGTVNGAAFTVSGYIVPSSLWHRDTPESRILFDTVDARVKAVRAVLLGSETLTIDGAAVPARHFAISGEIARDIWYDSNCALVRIALQGRDGVPIDFERV